MFDTDLDGNLVYAGYTKDDAVTYSDNTWRMFMSYKTVDNTLQWSKYWSDSTGTEKD